MITFTVGNDGGVYDYSAINNALAAVPSTLDDDYTIEIYKNTGGSLVWNEGVTRSAITTGGYSITIKGMFGDVRTPNTQVTVNNTGGTVWNFQAIFNNQFGVTLENFECTDATFVVSCQNPRSAMLRNLRIGGTVNTGIYRSQNGSYVVNCIIDAESPVEGYSIIRCYNCLIKGKNAVRATSSGPNYYYNCSIYNSLASTFGSMKYAVFVNSIYVSENNLLPENTAEFDLNNQRYFHGNQWRNSVLYSRGLGAGNINANQTLNEYFGQASVNLTEWGVFSYDPLFKETGDIQEFFELQSSSPALPINQTPTDNQIYLGNKRNLFEIGAYSDYQTPDFPAETDVRDGVAYNEGNLTGNVALPAVGDVRDATFYGANGTEFEGTLVVGVEPDTPTLDSITVGDGSATLSFTGANETDVIYARHRRNSPAYTWEDRSETFKRTGSGTITITGLINGIEYEFAGQAFAGSCFGDFGGSRFAAPDSDSFATCRYNSKLNRRNGIAQQALNVAQRFGVKITFKDNGPDAEAVVYANVSQPSTLTVGVRTGQIDRSDVIVTVPRQTNFPPSQFYPNCTFTLNEKSYQVDDIEFDNEDINMTSVFTLTASALGEEDGY